MDSFLASLKKLKKHGFKFLKAQKACKEQNKMDFTRFSNVLRFMHAKKFKKHGFNFFASLKKLKKHGFNFLRA